MQEHHENPAVAVREQVATTQTQDPARVYIHAMSDPDWEEITGIEDYEGRILACVPQDSLVICSTEINRAYLDYRNRVLGIDDGVMFARGSGKNLAQRILNDEALMAQLKKLAFERGLILDTFIVGPDEVELARALGVELLGDPEHTWHFGSKSGFREIARSIGLQVAPGFEWQDSLEKVIQCCRDLFANGFARVVVKGDRGASSAENINFTENDEAWEIRVYQLWQGLHNKSCAVERWFEDTSISPSIHFKITDNDVEPLLGPWQQVLSGANYEYAGIMHPIDAPFDITERLRKQGVRLAYEYQKRGYRGFLGFDTIIRENGEIIWIECNARKGGPYYPMRFAELVDLPTPVIWGRDRSSHELRKISFEDLVEQFQEQLFFREKGRGIVFYNVGLMQYGKIQTIIIASTRAEAALYWQIVEDRLP